MASRFLPLIFCIICLYGGCKIADINSGKTTETYIANKKTQCEKAVKAGALIQNEYTQVEMKSAIYYEYKYDFDVDGKTYSGTHTTSTKLDIPIVEVFYNSDDPNNVTSDDPCIIYDLIKDRPLRYPDWIEYIGMGIILLGIGFVRSSLVRAIKGSNG